MTWDFGGSTPTGLSGFVLSWKPKVEGSDEERRELESDQRNYTVPVDADMLYRFAIEAKFDDGSSSTASVNHTFNVPRQPVISSASATDTTIAVAWEPPREDTGAIRRPVDEFELTWVKDELGAKPNRQKFPKTATSHEITGLSPSTKYKITLVAHNPLGPGEGDKEDATTLPGDTPTPTPTPTPTYTPKPTPPNAVSLTIDVRPSDPNGPMDGEVKWELNGIDESTVAGFEITWRVTGSNEIEGSISKPSSARSLDIPDIYESGVASYSFKVRVNYADGSHTMHPFTVRIGIPAQPNLKITAQTQTTITVNWSFLGSAIVLPVLGYELTWKVKGTHVPIGSKSFKPEVSNYTIKDGLKPGTLYDVTILARNLLGDNNTTIYPTTLPEDTPTPTPPPTPTPTPTPNLTPTATPTTTPKPTPTRFPNREGYGRNGAEEPDSPENYYAVQGRDGIVIFWDNPHYEGVSDVYAYAVDWYPESPEFPIFLPETARTARIHGLNPDINYRVRVRAFNRHEDSLPAAQKIELAHTLLKIRPNDPFTGSITNGRTATLWNKTSLPGFEIHADARSIFWGDYLVLAVRRYSADEISTDITIPEGITLASDVYDVSAETGSRRKHFDPDATSYRFPSPIEICVQPSMTSSSIPTTDYSIAKLDTASEVFDSIPVDDHGTLKICARIPLLDLNQHNSFVVVSRFVPTPSVENVVTSDQQSQPALAIAMTLLLLGPAMVFAGARYFSIAYHPRRRVQHRMNRQ